MALLVRLKEEIAKKRPQMKKKKMFFHQNNSLCHKSIAILADLKTMLQGKIFRSNEEVIAEAEAYFEAKDKSFYKKGIEPLEKRWNECITLEEDYVDE